MYIFMVRIICILNMLIVKYNTANNEFVFFVHEAENLFGFPARWGVRMM